MVAPRITRKKRPQRPVQMFVPPPPQTVAPVQPTAPASMFAGPLSNRGTDFVPGASSGAAPAPGFDWASLASGLGAGLLTGKNWGEGVGQGMVLANQFGAQKRQDAFNEQRMKREDERFGFEKQKYQAELDEAAAAKAERDALDQSTNMFLAPWLNDVQGDEPPGVNLTPQSAMFISKLPVEKRIEALSPIMMPKAQEPYSAIAKAKADLDAGRISPEEFDAFLRKETYIAPQQGPQQPERVRLALEAGLTPGTPEYQQFLLGRDDTPTGPFQGTGLDAQAYNIVLTGDPSSPEYAAAYNQLAMPKVTGVDPTTGKAVVTSPDLSWARQPGYSASSGPTGAPPQRPGPTVDAAQALQPMNSAGQPLDAMKVPGATIYSNPGAPVFTETQGKAATFADRIAASNKIFEDTLGAGTDKTQEVLSGVPFVSNYLISGDRQRFEQAERDFINAILRRESGAVIIESEFKDARQQYIPQPWDDEKTLAQKKAARERTLRGMSRDAGPRYTPEVPSNTTVPSGGTFVPQLPQGDWQ